MENTNIERTILDVIYNCGGITKKGVEKVFGNENTIRDLLEKKYIRKKPVEVRGKRIALYDFSDAGESYYFSITGKNHFFRCMRPEKIVALSYFYISEKDQCSDWKNKEEWFADGDDGIVPDGTYIKDGNLCGVSVVRTSEKERIENGLKSFTEKNGVKQVGLILFS